MPRRESERPALPAALTALQRGLDHVHASGVIPARSGVELQRSLHPVLATIAEFEPIRLTDLAVRLGLEAPTVSRHVGKLAKIGLVLRRPDPADRRATLLTTSSRGRRTLDALYRAWEEILAEQLGDDGNGESTRITAAVRRLASALAAVPPTDAPV